MLEVTPNDIQKILLNPMSRSVIGKDEISSVSRLIPILPELKGEHLPDLRIVLDTLVNGPIQNSVEDLKNPRKRKRDEFSQEQPSKRIKL